MDNFLTSVVKDLLTRYGNRFEDVLIIMPGKRPKVFINHIISQLVDKPLIAPKVLTINEFVEMESHMLIIDSIPAINALYDIYKQQITSSDPIEKFWHFGEMLLSDFDDLDKYMADVEKVFTYVKDLKEIEQLFYDADDEQLKLIKQFWSSVYTENKDDNNHIRNQFLIFWKILYPLYVEFKNNLVQQGVGYEGMLYRNVAKKAQNDSITFNGKIPVFIGFNALSKSEVEMFSAAKRNGGFFYWDYDVWYTDNAIQEAGHFMRKNLAMFPSALENEDFFNNISKIAPHQLQLIAMPGELEMAMAAARKLDETQVSDSNPMKIAVVPANESLLIPLLDTIPSTVGVLNVTMGLPVSNTAIFSLVNELFSIHKNRIESKSEVFYKGEWVLSVLQQPIHIGSTDNELSRIRTDNIYYIKASDYANNEWLSALFPVQDVSLIGYLKNVLHLYIRFCTVSAESPDIVPDGELNAEAAVAVYKALSQLEMQFVRYKVTLPNVLIVRLLHKIMSGLKVTLEGEPLRGKQIMGLIETRSLDFENVILVGVNEGFMPKSGIAPSFIPYNIRKAYGLLTYEHQDAIFAYYFYRLVQRAKNITIIYNSNENDADYGELSRFVQQLMFERGFEQEVVTGTHRLEAMPSSKICIPKTEQMLQVLAPQSGDADAQFYPLGLNTYLTCRLKFYFKYVAKVRPAEQFDTQIDQRIFGNIFHDAMMNLYAPFHSQVITPELIKVFGHNDIVLKEIRNQINIQFKNFSSGVNQSGLLNIVEQVVFKYIKKVLENDGDSGDFMLKSVEEKYQTSMVVDDKRVILAGKIDRMQEQNNQIFVIDYKTGKPPKSGIKFDAMFQYGLYKRPSAPFQAMLYAYIIKQQSFAMHQEVVPALLYIQQRKPIDSLVFSDKKDVNLSELHQYFKSQLEALLSEILCLDIPFDQTPDAQNCAFCEYNIICARNAETD